MSSGRGVFGAPLADPRAQVQAAFRRRYGADPEHVVFAPGRVNLLGGHVDYNLGRVLPVAIDRGVWCAIRAAPGRRRLASAAFDRTVDLDAEPDPPSWAGLFFGAREAVDEARPDRARGQDADAAARPDGPDAGAAFGFEALLLSDLPIGAGLSSSAASAVAFLVAALRLRGAALGPLEVAELARRAEHLGLGVRCGLMDPLVSAAGRRGFVLDLDCRDGAFEHLPLPRGRAAIVVVPTPTQRRLAGSAYNARRAAGERVVAALRAVRPEVRSLRDVPDVRWLDDVPLEAEDRRRARHVIEEMARVEAGRAALRAGDLEAFGALMYAAHDSLRDLYAVSTPALDAAIGVCRAAPESFGGRLTGAGFGGATVHLVRPEGLEAFLARFEGAVALSTADGPLGGPRS